MDFCLRLLVCVVLLAAVPVVPVRAGEPAAVLATYAYTRYDRAAALQPLAEHLQRRLGRTVEVRVLESPRALAAALRDGTVDAAVTNTFVYLGVRDLPSLRAAAVFDVPAATLDAYRGVLLARRDGPAATLAAVQADAARLRYAQVIPGSTSGGMVQDLFLAGRGLSAAQFASIRQTGTHEAALAAVVDGHADLAALADAPWQSRRREGKAGDLVELWRSPPIPPGPLVCRDGGRIDCARLASLLASLHDDAPAALAAVVAAWSEAAGAARLIPVEAAPYDALTAGFADAAAGRAALDKLL